MRKEGNGKGGGGRGGVTGGGEGLGWREVVNKNGMSLGWAGHDWAGWSKSAHGKEWEGMELWK